MRIVHRLLGIALLAAVVAIGAGLSSPATSAHAAAAMPALAECTNRGDLTTYGAWLAPGQCVTWRFPSGDEVVTFDSFVTSGEDQYIIKVKVGDRVYTGKALRQNKYEVEIDACGVLWVQLDPVGGKLWVDAYWSDTR